ncbi:MAG: EAL domain-containing protein [Sphingobium sp.]|nr:EAL domain-containing protein [Sphingobium sp.]
MDRFADRRFHGPVEEWRIDDALLPPRNKLLASDNFDQLSAPLIRWAADDDGRLLAFGGDPAAFGFSAASDINGFGWRAALTPGGVRALLRAALRSARPAPLMLRVRQAGGEWRWMQVRLMRGRDDEGRALWIGTIQERRDGQDCAAALRDALTESQEHYRWAMELSTQVPWTASADGAIEEVGPRWQTLTGMAPQDALGHGWISAVHPDDVDPTRTSWSEHLESGLPFQVDFRIRLNEGAYRWMRSRAAARRNEQGRIVRWYGTLEDVHDQKLAQNALADGEERLRLAVQSAQIGIWDYDLLLGKRTWSREFRAMLGLGDEDEATAERALSLVHAADRDQLRRMMEAIAARIVLPHFEATLRVHRADTGALRWIRSVGSTTVTQSGEPRRVIVTFQDVTDQREAEERIRWTASHDPLTAMPNRALFQERLEQMAPDAKRTGEPFGLLLFDIDDLKRTNDMLGHDAGDALLRNFAARLSEVAPADAAIGRLGGDEFGLIAPSLGSPAALEACSEALVTAFRRPCDFQGRQMDCAVSMGAAIFGEHGEDAQEVLKAADLALYASKAQARGRLTLFHPQLRAEAQQRSSMISMAREALSQDLVEPYYQPKVDLRSGRILGYEALLRWRHPRLGVQLPGSITAAFDHAEIAVALTGKMLDHVIEDICRWRGEGFDPGPIAVNVSAADFQHDDFAEQVLERLARRDLPMDAIEIEVTETVFLGRGAQQVERALALFARQGMRIALDDFGTGYASLTHLKQYPVDVLKIDRSFIQNIEHDAGDAVIVDAIVTLGASLGIEVVAEGVETAAQLDLLKRQGCLIGQGFLLGRPAPASTVRPDAMGVR